MRHTRRGVLGAAGALIIGGAGAGHVLGDSHISIEINVNAEDEYVVLENTGDESVDLSGYTVDFEYQEPQDQLYELPEGTVLEAGAQLVVATGALDVSDADLTVEDNDNYWLTNEDPDAVGGPCCNTKSTNTVQVLHAT